MKGLTNVRVTLQLQTHCRKRSLKITTQGKTRAKTK